MWVRLGCPEQFTIVEQGAHGGDFAFDAISQLHRSSPNLHAHLEYVIVEPSAAARAAQHEKLGTFGDRIRWVADLPEMGPFTGVHFSNELIDAFPIHLVTWNGEAWLERHVNWADDQFAFIDAALTSTPLTSHLSRLPAVPAGYTTEVNLAALDWIAQLAPQLERGFVLAVDYGFSRDEYYRPERTNGTLSAYAQHRREANPLARPGEIDLTAHIDFTSLAERAITSGLDLLGFTDQHHFIVGLSPFHFGDAPPSPADLRAFKTLMHPELLGRAFKAICFSRGVPGAPPLAGFQFATDPPAALGLH
jgi:SAM-dependent MidA family methyltransferase